MPATSPSARPALPRRPAGRVTARVAFALVTALTAACRASGDGQAATVSRPPAGGETAAKSAGGTGEPMPADSVALRAAADRGRIAGDSTGKVWMIIASDFQCPYCKMWHDQTYEAIRHDYVDAGKLRIAYLNFPLEQHVQAMAAAEAAMCASAQGKFWPYHTALFQSVDRWGQSGDQSAAFDSLAGAVGVDAARFRTCTRSHVMRALIEADKYRMEKAGVASTPSFFVGNARLEGAQPLGVFRQAIDSALAKSGR